jgi:predicted CoA-substrate-specific enzyme activase
MRRLGIDIGSLTVSAAILDVDGVEPRPGDGVELVLHREHGGDIAAAVRALVAEAGSWDLVGVSGVGTGKQSGLLIDPALATIEGARFLLPGVRSLFAVGAQSFSLVLYDENGRYREHAVNPPCASGTGSFVEQQARRLGLDVQEFAARALRHAGERPLIATRCAVFAKTDIVHAMQEGYGLEAVCAGLCDGIARNLVDVLVKGRALARPVGIVGGVSLNASIVKSLGEALGLPLTVPAHSRGAAAVGAALLARQASSWDGLPGELLSALHLDRTPPAASGGARAFPERAARPALTLALSDYPDFDSFRVFRDDSVEVFLPPGAAAPSGALWLGIDIGSTSTKSALVGPGRTVLGGFYTATAGEPVAAVRRLVESMERLWPGVRSLVAGVATTGSGRKMIRELFRAEMAVDEITAHARAAVHLRPRADTIIEIGGQDSKFTRLRDGEVYFSTMNYACAAGTGSFIEEQAQRLGVDLDGFSRLAAGARAPFTSDRCTVYMERDLGELLAEGWSREAVAAAVLHSVRDNYLARVVSRSPLGDYVVFQGATARNPALVAAFEQHLGRPVHVSPFCHLTGAIGAALLLAQGKAAAARGAGDVPASAFLWDSAQVELSTEACRLCSNHCLLTVAGAGGARTAWGMKCGREYSAMRRRQEQAAAPELRFREAMRPLAGSGGAARRPERVGLPGALYEAELAPLWKAFLEGLGFTVVEGSPGRRALEKGHGLVNSDFCAPMVAAHGHVEQMLRQGVDYVFFPAVVNEEDPSAGTELLYRRKTSDDYFCYYSQYLPTIVSRLTTLDVGDRLISPLVHFRGRTDEQTARELHAELSRAFPQLGEEEVLASYSRARRVYLECRAAWRQEAARLLVRAARSMSADSDRVKVVLLGRPYVIFDRALNLDIPRKLEELGAEVFWQEELATDDSRIGYAGRYLERMHWHFGKSILRAAQYAAVTPGVYPVFLTCFRCSPDSFLVSYVKDILDHCDKPFLVLQLDEHASDVGYTTRIEAGLRTFRSHLARSSGRAGASAGAPNRARSDALSPGDTVLVPYVDDLLSRFWADCFIRGGFDARVLAADEKALAAGYRYANGGECMPLVSILGGAIEEVRAGSLDPARTYMYLPTTCHACNFPQFPILADLVFRSAGLEGIKIGLLNGMALSEGLPQAVVLRMLEANIVAGILDKLRRRIQPYEVTRGDTDRVFRSAADRMSRCIRESDDMRAALGEEVQKFRAVARDERAGRKPRIGVLGDLYVRYSDAANQRVLALVEELGGELVIGSFTEYALHYYWADVHFHADDPRHYRLLRAIEGRYEHLAADLVGEQAEPDLAECAKLMEAWRIRHMIVGETSINVGRALYYLEHGLVDALIHLNPIFCCPGVVTASIYRKIQEDYGVPIVDLFYDGTGNPNQVLIPHLAYLRRGKGGPTAARG